MSVNTTPVSNKRILVGMSGGVDSSVAAYLLKADGWDVTGITMLLWGGAKNGKSCSTSDSIKAQIAADNLGIDLLTVDWTEEFDNSVVNVYQSGLNKGKILNPCISCNSKFKVDALLEYAQTHNYSHVATGHYIQTATVNDTEYIKRGIDSNKDQSYVMHMIPADQRTKFIFPLGNLTKTEIRTIANRNSLPAADAPESMDLCFNPATDVTTTAVPVILMRKGIPIGNHPDGTRLSIGQRKGMNVSGSTEPLYVGTKDLPNNTVELYGKEGMDSTELSYDGPPLPKGTTVYAQMSAHGTPVQGVMDGNTVTFVVPARRTSPGQTVVFYGTGEYSDCVIGGGIITDF